MQETVIRDGDIDNNISLRIISMIVNEAYFALGDGISTKEEIDIAMKLGTNYPYGPFEWSQRIGLKKIFALLQNLGGDDPRYAVAPLLRYDVEMITNTPDV